MKPKALKDCIKKFIDEKVGPETYLWPWYIAVRIAPAIIPHWLRGVRESLAQGKWPQWCGVMIPLCIDVDSLQIFIAFGYKKNRNFGSSKSYRNGKRRNILKGYWGQPEYSSGSQNATQFHWKLSVCNWKSFPIKHFSLQKAHWKKQLITFRSKVIVWKRRGGCEGGEEDRKIGTFGQLGFSCQRHSRKKQAEPDVVAKTVEKVGQSG